MRAGDSRTSANGGRGRRSGNATVGLAGVVTGRGGTITGVTPNRVTTDARDSYPRAIRTELGKMPGTGPAAPCHGPT